MNRIYIETPIDQTEGLEDGWYYVLNPNKEILPRMIQWYNKTWNNWNEMNISSYLRPAPDNSVVVEPTDFEKFIEWVNDNYERENKKGWSNLWLKDEDGLEYTTKEIVNQFIQTKLAQMGK
jgi:hypothetical protein